jgi:hexosaminidase
VIDYNGQMPIKLLLFGAGLVGLSAALMPHGVRVQQASSVLSVMPQPADVALDEGFFRLNGDFRVGALLEANPRVRRAAARFITRLSGRTGFFLAQEPARPLDWTEGTALFLKYAREGRLEPGEDESYLLLIASTRIVLDAPTDIGILRGLETLLQLLDADETGFFFPCLQVKDGPRFTWRGLLIDAGRHFMPVDVVKRNLDGMAAVKMNVLHWHLSEDQGFRVESKTYPKLHQLGSDGDYYTQEQVRDVIAYASDLGIRVVPEFDIPGHSTSWFVGYPELASAPGRYSIERRFGVMDPSFNPAEEKVYEFFDRFFGEMASLFPDPYLHIGGDENNGKHWDANPEIQAFKKAHGLADNNALQAYFNGRILKILSGHGKKMIGWDEILQPGLPKDIVIQSWRGKDALASAAKRGYAGLLSNGFYIDLCQPASFHYANDPLPDGAGLTEAERSLILGGEATMWTEIVSSETVDSRVWPRTAAVAERLWSPASVRDEADMYRRLDTISLRLEELGLTHLKNQDVLLRRLAGPADITALRNFVDVLEPVKRYKRHESGRTYTQFSPLTRIVDAAFPESRTARLFREAVDDYLAGRDAGTAAEIREQLQWWKDNNAALVPVLRGSPALGEVEPVAADLAGLSDVGLAALASLSEGRKLEPAWTEAAEAVIKNAGTPKAEVELPIVPAVEKLVRAAAGRR